MTAGRRRFWSDAFDSSTITLSANALDSDGTVSKVEFFQGAVKLGEDTTAPYAYDWTNVAAGDYVVRADQPYRTLADMYFSLQNYAVGNPARRIVLRHILPNIIPPLLVQATLATAAAIIAESTLSFLGLGVQPPTPSWGSMLNVAQGFLNQAPWMAWWPGLAIFVTVLAFNVVGDGLHDALDPKQY